jgi:hypothetical protein
MTIEGTPDWAKNPTGPQAPVAGSPNWSKDDSNQFIQLLHDCLSEYENGQDLIKGIRVMTAKGVWDIDKFKSLVEATGIPKEQPPQAGPQNFSESGAKNADVQELEKIFNGMSMGFQIRHPSNFAESRRCNKCKSGKLLSEFQPCPGCKAGEALKYHIQKYLTDPCYDGNGLQVV